MSTVNGDDDGAAVIAVLKWIVNPALPVPEIATVDEERLVSLAVGHHRILPSLLARLDAARPIWCPISLITRLRFLKHKHEQQMKARIAAACEISRAMQERGLRPPLFIKGIAAYALTGRLEDLYLSGDHDLLAEDLPALWDVLRDLGYSGKRKDTHEWAKLWRGDSLIDVHRYFPVMAYPREVRQASACTLAASRNPGHWHLPLPATERIPVGRNLCWEDLQDGEMSGIAKGTEALRFPSPTMLCLVHSAHCFRSMVTRLHYMNPPSGFRMHELLGIRDLALLPDFDPILFRSLTERYAAQDVVRTINDLAREFLGGAVLPEAAGEREPLFPEHLVYGGWISLQTSSDLLRPSGAKQTLAQMGSSMLISPCYAPAGTLSRMLVCGAEAEPLTTPDLALVWDEPERELTIGLTFADRAFLPAGIEALVHFGHDSSVHISLDEGRRIDEVVYKSDYLRPGEDQVKATIQEGGAAGRYQLSLTCPLPYISSLRKAGEPVLPLLLVIRRRTPSGDTEAVSYLPILLTRGQA